MTDIEAAMLRNEFGRIIALALSSQGYASTDSSAVGLAFLRELEEQGVTLRLTTDVERATHNDPAAMADLARKAEAWDRFRDRFRYAPTDKAVWCEDPGAEASSGLLCFRCRAIEDLLAAALDVPRRPAALEGDDETDAEDFHGPGCYERMRRAAALEQGDDPRA